MIFLLHRIEAAPRQWGAVARALRGRESNSLYGLWSGLIGIGSNQGLAITIWPDHTAAHAGAERTIDGIAGIANVEHSYLEATVRPQSPEPPAKEGVYAFRWFDLAEADWPAFRDLSSGAWPAFEAKFGARIWGFFRDLAVAPPRRRMLLLTSYPSLAVWEASRPTNTGQDQNTEHALQRFRDRRLLTDATIVFLTQPV